MDSEALIILGCIAFLGTLYGINALLYYYGKNKWIGYKFIRIASWYLVYRSFYLQQLDFHNPFVAQPLASKLYTEEATDAFVRFGFPGFTRWLTYQGSSMSKSR